MPRRNLYKGNLAAHNSCTLSADDYSVTHREDSDKILLRNASVQSCCRTSCWQGVCGCTVPERHMQTHQEIGIDDAKLHRLDAAQRR